MGLKSNLLLSNEKKNRWNAELTPDVVDDIYVKNSIMYNKFYIINLFYMIPK